MKLLNKLLLYVYALFIVFTSLVGFHVHQLASQNRNLTAEIYNDSTLISRGYIEVHDTEQRILRRCNRNEINTMQAIDSLHNIARQQLLLSDTKVIIDVKRSVLKRTIPLESGLLNLFILLLVVSAVGTIYLVNLKTDTQ